MKRIALVAVAVMLGAFASTASASTGAVSNAHRSATQTGWSAEYDATEYYGAVKCTGEDDCQQELPVRQGGPEVRNDRRHSQARHSRQGTESV